MSIKVSIPKVSVFQFTDVRSYLKTYVQACKAQNPKWSLGLWARQLGLSAAAPLTNLLAGRRTPGEAMQQKLVRYFKFNAKEESYFRDLVRLKKVSKDPSLAISVMERLGRHHPDRTFRLLDDREFQSIAGWHYYALREMVALPQFDEDFERLSKKLGSRVKPSEVKKALSDLQAIGLLKRDEMGRLQRAEIEMSSSEDVASEALKRFHESMIDQARSSLREVAVELRDISGCTFNLNPEKLPQLKQLIRDFRYQVDALFTENSEQATTYQFNLQLFPLTQENSRSPQLKKESL